MEEIKCEQVAQIESKGYNDMTGRVYSVDGLSPTMRTFCGGNQEAKIMVENKIEPTLVGGFGEMKSNGGTQYYQQDRVYDSESIAMSHCASIPSGSYNYLVYDGFNQTVKKDNDTCGTITRNVGADLKRNGQGIIEVMAYDEQNQYLRQDGTVGTLTTDGSSPKHNNRVVEYELSDKMKRYINSYNDKYQVSNGNLVVNKGIASPITTREGCVRADASSYTSVDLPQDCNITGMDMTQYRVRKLTEKECGKLMGVLPEDIEKIGKNQSRSSQYHLYGDSIVTTVLMAWFGELFDVDWKSKVDNVVNELTGG